MAFNSPGQCLPGSKTYRSHASLRRFRAATASPASFTNLIATRVPSTAATPTPTTIAYHSFRSLAFCLAATAAGSEGVLHPPVRQAAVAGVGTLRARTTTDTAAKSSRFTERVPRLR